MAAFAAKVRDGSWTGHTGKRIRNVVNIGIGGSYLGPEMAYLALRRYSDRGLDLPFRLQCRWGRLQRGNARSRCGRDAVRRLVQDLHHAGDDDQRRDRARVARRQARLARPPSPATSWPSRPTRRRSSKFGIDPANMFGFWDWVGGRYSMDSAIGLSTMIAIGADNFRAMLDGFHAMDEHFRTAPLPREPAGAARAADRLVQQLLRRRDAIGVMPYAQHLARFPAYLQQLQMESNGKTRRSRWHAASTIRPGPSSGASPAPMRSTPSISCIHQGTKLIPCDLIGFLEPLSPLAEHHDLLMANLFAQAEALAFGKTAAELVSRRRRRPAQIAVPRHGRQPPDQHDPGRAPRSARRSARSSRSTSTASSRKARSGRSTRSTSGASSSARCWQTASCRSSRPQPSRSSRTTARPTRSSGATARIARGAEQQQSSCGPGSAPDPQPSSKARGALRLRQRPGERFGDQSEDRAADHRERDHDRRIVHVGCVRLSTPSDVSSASATVAA